MKKYLLALIILLMSVSVSQSAVVSKIVGLNSECDTTLEGCQYIPLTSTEICTISCPRQTRPSLTDVNRMWGSALGGTGICQTSTDGGGTWAGCTTQPFSSGGKESYAGTADGSVVGAAVVAGECRISRSINNGTSWSQVHAIVGGTCGGALVGPTQITCFTDGLCTLHYRNASAQFVVVQSTDNGQSWSTVFTGVATATAVQALSYNNGYVVVPATGVGTRGVEGSGGGWTGSVAWGGGAVTCWGGYVLNSVGFGLCNDAITGYLKYNNLTGAVVSSPILPGALVAGDAGGVSVGYKTNIVYTLATRIVSGSNRIGIYASRDSGASYALIGTTSVVGTGVREGDFWQHPMNGCLYFSAGTPTIQNGKIC